MIGPLSLCLEDLDASLESERYLCCSAMPGRGPGLRVRRDGVVAWMSDEATAVELAVTADERLAVLRVESAPGVVLARAGRELGLPAGKPVVALPGDELCVAGRRYRVHVHGPAARATAPWYFRTAVAAGVAATAALASASACHPIEVREQPPMVLPDPPPPELPGSVEAPDGAEPPSDAPPPEQLPSDESRSTDVLGPATVEPAASAVQAGGSR